ncbi:MAG: translation elongation factor 4 [Phycisphaerae bacterium]
MEIKNRRNFSIIAHIDHGKSTLADRLIQTTGAVSSRQMREQILDTMDLERERGITIKASAITLFYEYQGEAYELNMIDTPGHVDFHYEVSRALASCEGALLIVDATQGVQAQTVANAYLATASGLEIVPVINKIDLPAAQPDVIAEEIEHILGMPAEDALNISAKSGVGIDELLEAIVTRLPSPKGDPDAPLQALIFDSIYDDYRGVVTYIRVFNGTIRKGDKILLMSFGRTYQVIELGQLRPEMTPQDKLQAGQVGYCIANIKELSDVRVGDTITQALHPAPEGLPGYKPPQQMVFCDFYPGSDTEYLHLKQALEKLQLNDASFTFFPENSEALGLGFRCGFLGLLHLDIIQERLEREAGITVVQTAPTVSYEVLQSDGAVLRINSPAKMPDPSAILEIREPMVETSIIVPADGVGGVMKLAEKRRGIFKHSEYLSPTRVMLKYHFPLAEIIYDFYDKLKTVTRGYGTLDYELSGYEPADLVKLDILVAGKRVDALSIILHRSVADIRGRRVLTRLRQEIPRQMFECALQAAIGSRVIARETISAMRKNVTAKCYGGDISRKRKLLEKQKEGKKRMKQVGNVQIPQEAFIAILDQGDSGSND